MAKELLLRLCGKTRLLQPHVERLLRHFKAVEKRLCVSARFLEEETLRTLRVAAVFEKPIHQKKARRGNFPRRAWIDLTKLEFKV